MTEVRAQQARSAAATNAVTVCTVSFHNAPHLRLNWMLADALNRDGSEIRWVVAENTPSGSKDRLTADDSRFKVIEGVGPEHVPNFQHTIALHKCFEFVTTRFLLVLDPDFYLVRPQWVDAVTRHMLSHDLAFFGVPWHPRFSDKYRYFPAVHCFFVDLDRVGIDALEGDPLLAPVGLDDAFEGILHVRGSQLAVVIGRMCPAGPASAAGRADQRFMALAIDRVFPAGRPLLPSQAP